MKLVKKKIEGTWMWLNPHDRGISHRLIAKGGREPCFMYVLKKEAFGIAYDVGANLGYTMLPMADRCDKVYAWEPDDRSRMLLEKNVELNKLKNVVISRKAISNVCGWKTFEMAAKPNLSKLANKEPVEKILNFDNKTPVVTIDFYGGYPNFIKMDIEGGEVNALKGAMKTLKAAKDLKILIEVHPQHYSSDNDFSFVLCKLMDMGYGIKYIINAKGKRHLFKGYKLVKEFKKFPRAIYEGQNTIREVEWICTFPKDGLKVVRAILLERKV